MRPKRILALGATFVGLALLILWAGGAFVGDKIEPGPTAPEVGAETPEATTQATLRSAPDLFEAVGTVRPRTETKIEAQVQAKVLEVKVRPGDKVAKGDPLIVLDSREIASRSDQAAQGLREAVAGSQQARQNIAATQAAFDEAQAQYKRIKALHEKDAVTNSEMDQAEAQYLRAEAQLRQARDALAGAAASVSRAQKQLEEAEIVEEHAVIRAHEDGEIAQRSVEPGDLAFPGKTLLLLQAVGSLRLEALVREGVIDRIQPGREFEVRITALENSGRDRLNGVVEEIEPSADPRTRSFLVKVGLPAVRGLYPGMFGRLLVPLDEREVVTAPRAAVRRVGQLETVDVLDGEVWRTVYVKTGREFGDEVEILSGLQGGETIAIRSGDHA